MLNERKYYNNILRQDDVARKADSDSDFCLEDREMERRRTSVQPVSFHQPSLNYTVNPCYQPNNSTTDVSTNPDEPYVILNLHRR